MSSGNKLKILSLQIFGNTDLRYSPEELDAKFPPLFLQLKQIVAKFMS